jgi:hypothetical protein
VRVAVLAPAVPGADESGARWLYGLRDLYSATMRQALEAEGRIAVVDEATVFQALEACGARADRAIEPGVVREACAKLGADALAHGTIEPEEGGLAVRVALYDGRDGRLLGELDANVKTAPEVASLARRHAVLWKSALGVE